jgi:hypothetical protein
MFTKTKFTKSKSTIGLCLAIVLVVGLTAIPARSADDMDAEANKILRSMSDYLAGLSAFSMNADIENEFVNLDGQKLQLNSYSTILLQRPSAFKITRQGMFADAVIFFDGKTVTIHGKELNAYVQFESKSTIDDAVRNVEFELNYNAPGADLLFSDPYSVLSSGVRRADYIGVSYVNGVECHHLAFREEQVDWQLFVQAGDRPLPMKYVITSKWVTGAPQYSVTLRDWNTNPKVNHKQFTFVVLENAKKLDTLLVNELGELTQIKENQ